MDIICKHGCGCQGRYLIGKNYCCEKNVSRCPAIRAKLAKKQTGVAPWNKGKTGEQQAWNKGKTNEELYGKEKAAELSARVSAKLIGHPNLGVAGTKKTEEQRREKIRNSINKRYKNGWMPKAGRCKKIDYNSPIAGLIKVDGTWELEVAQYLDKIGVKWKRNKNRFAYNYDSKERFYTPDFLLFPNQKLMVKLTPLASVFICLESLDFQVTVYVFNIEIRSIKSFPWDLFFGWDNTCCAVKINKNSVSFYLLDESIDYLAFFCAIFVYNRASFGFTNTLNNDLFRCLGCYSAVFFLGFKRKNYFITNFYIFFDFPCIF
jgi:hypothetical protein